MAATRVRTVRRTAAGVAEVAAPARRAPAARAADETDPAYTRAILKIALELRKPGARSYDDVVEETIRRMKLDGSAFRRYLGENGARNMSLLLSAARRFGP